MRTRLNAAKNTGTLLLDTLIALSIFALVFSTTYFNYAYAQSYAAVTADVQELDALNTAATLYTSNNAGLPAGSNGQPNGGSGFQITTTSSLADYITGTPSSKLGAAGFNFETGSQSGFEYAVVDEAPLGNGYYPFFQSLYSSWTEHGGSTCTQTDHLAIAGGNVYCATDANGS